MEQIEEKCKQHPDLGLDHPGTLGSEVQHARILGNLGRYDEAANIAKNVVEKMQQHRDLGPDHPDTLEAQCTYAINLFRTSSKQAGIELATEILKKMEINPVLGPSHPQTLKAKEILKTMRAEMQADLGVMSTESANDQ